jgi:hypothetical protein
VNTQCGSPEEIKAKSILDLDFVLKKRAFLLGARTARPHWTRSVQKIAAAFVVALHNVQKPARQ